MVHIVDYLVKEWKKIQELNTAKKMKGLKMISNIKTLSN